MTEPNANNTLTAVREHLDNRLLFAPESIVQRVAYLLNYMEPDFLDSNFRQADSGPLEGTLVAYSATRVVVANVTNREGLLQITATALPRTAVVSVRTTGESHIEYGPEPRPAEWPTGMKIEAGYVGLDAPVELPLSREGRVRIELERFVPTLLADLDK